MDKPFKTTLGSTHARTLDSDPKPIQVLPFGTYGAGLLTGHPVGLLVVAAVCFIAWTLPEARWFTLFSLPLGALVGLVLWLRNRQKNLDSPPSLDRKSN